LSAPRCAREAGGVGGVIKELFELPDGWKVSTLGDVCKTTSPAVV